MAKHNNAIKDFDGYSMYMNWLIETGQMIVEPKKEKTVMCNRCGLTGLHWENKEYEGWRLYTNDNKLHNCKRK